MNIVVNIYIYLIIAGLMAGVVINADYEQCGTQKKGQPYEYIVKSLLWPVIVTSVIISRKDAVSSPVCEE